MDWLAFDSLLRCEPGDIIKTIFALIGATAGLVTVIGAAYRLYRWWVGPKPRHRRAAKVLRSQGELCERLNHRQQAMELYDLSIQLNPRAGHVYYLRGCLYETLGNISRAVADWKRCVAQLPKHTNAQQKLETHERGSAGSWPWTSPRPAPLVPRWAYFFGTGAAVLATALVAIFAL